MVSLGHHLGSRLARQTTRWQARQEENKHCFLLGWPDERAVEASQLGGQTTMQSGDNETNRSIGLSQVSEEAGSLLELGALCSPLYAFWPPADGCRVQPGKLAN